MFFVGGGGGKTGKKRNEPASKTSFEDAPKPGNKKLSVNQLQKKNFLGEGSGPPGGKKGEMKKSGSSKSLAYRGGNRDDPDKRGGGKGRYAGERPPM